MIVASYPQISLPLYLERTRKALRARSLPRPGRGVKTHLQPRPRPADRVHPEWLPAFSSPNLSPFNFKRSAVDRTFPSLSPNSHRITTFAYPYPLTPIESHSCKKQGGPPYPKPAASDLISLRNTQESPQPQSLHAFTP